MTLLILEGVDITHSRLVELTNLADQAEAFYEWVEERFQNVLSRRETLEQLLQSASRKEIRKAIADCYRAKQVDGLPLLFDGVGRSYQHSKACYYFFSWLIRDAPQQRLAPLIGRMVKNSRRNRTELEIDALAALICKYRSNVKTFSWVAVREVITDRLEGSRRSLKGHEKEAIVRTALLAAFQTYFAAQSNYGIFAGVEIADKQVMVGAESFDVSANLLDKDGQRLCRVLVPIKTRETEGGGHAHLFTRDIRAAINAARHDNADDYLVVVIAARNWSSREAEVLRQQVDHVALFAVSPSEWSEFNDEEQERLNRFIAAVLDGAIIPKAVGE
ncbi:MAG: hypothetical protein H0T45_14200 [Pyrinomonadaceae bacterium]|nr:hypothetical protein [Pyrinomonadaceae bacterium]